MVNLDEIELMYNEFYTKLIQPHIHLESILQVQDDSLEKFKKESEECKTNIENMRTDTKE